MNTMMLMMIMIMTTKLYIYITPYLAVCLLNVIRTYYIEKRFLLFFFLGRRCVGFSTKFVYKGLISKDIICISVK